MKEEMINEDFSDLEVFSNPRAYRLGHEKNISIYIKKSFRFSEKILNEFKKTDCGIYVYLGFSRKMNIITFQFINYYGNERRRDCYKICMMKCGSGYVQAANFFDHFKIDVGNYKGIYIPGLCLINNETHYILRLNKLEEM